MVLRLHVQMTFLPDKDFSKTLQHSIRDSRPVKILICDIKMEKQSMDIDIEGTDIKLNLY